jgi:hypothetical protein
MNDRGKMNAPSHSGYFEIEVIIVVLVMSCFALAGIYFALLAS